MGSKEPEIRLGTDGEAYIEERNARARKDTHPLYGHLDLDLYSPEDLATRIGCTSDHIHKEIKENKLKARKWGGPLGWRILHEDVMAWLRTS